MARGWYVVRIQPRAEYLAASELEHDGFEIFFPCVKSPYARVGHSDTPLFPGYLFLRWNSEDEGWPSFRPAHRVSGWVNFDGVIPIVPDEVVINLIQRVKDINGGDGLWRRFRLGERVRVVSDALESLGEIAEEPKSPNARAKVLLHFMGRLVQTQVPWDKLRPIEEPISDRPRLPRRTRGGGRWIKSARPSPAVTA